MNVRSLKLAGAVAGLLFLVGAAPTAFAQTAVLNVDATGAVARPNEFISTFTFNQSLILNAIGIPNVAGTTFKYKIGSSASYTTITDTLGSAENGFRYFTFTNPQTYTTGTTVTIFSTKDLSATDTRWYTRTITTTNAVGVTHTSNLNATFATGNIKVSNPSSNVAPEPGSIALLLTGGGALAGIALRRRRNAA